MAGPASSRRFRVLNGRVRRIGVAAAVSALVAAAGCSSGGAGAGGHAGHAGGSTSTAHPWQAGAPSATRSPWFQLAPVQPGGGASDTAPCDPLDPTACLLPFPDNFYTRTDASSPTGVAVHFPTAAMPVSSAGVPIDPSLWSSSDGFSPGSQILVHVPGLDVSRSGIAPETDIGSSLSGNAPIIVLDVSTGVLWPYWASLDANDPVAAEQALVISPAASLIEGDTYVVALRNLRDVTGAVVQPGADFAAYLNGGAPPAADTALDAARSAHMQSILAALGKAGVGKGGLFVAWDFTVASARNITGRLLHMRDTAFAQIGNGAPTFHVDSVVDYSASQNAHVSRKITGTFQVPSYLDQPGGPIGSSFSFGPDGLPVQSDGNIQNADFTCILPRSADANPLDPASPVTPAHPSIYGHGLFGTAASEVPDLNETSDSNDMAFCGTDWIGMSQLDIPEAVKVLQNISLFPAISDRLQQGVLDAMFLGRLMDNAAGFASDPAFRAAGPGSPLLVTGHGVVYYGNSLGGVMGGTLTAVSTEIPRSVLGVPGMDFSMMMPRSLDFSNFYAVISGSYPDKLTEITIEDMIQVLWDRAETDGYAQFMTSHPLPGTPAHTVMIQYALGDHQVPNIATENEARTIGAYAHEPEYASGRSHDVAPMWGILPIPSYPFTGNTIFLWDNGTATPPATDVPDSSGPDPHNHVPRELPAAQKLLGEFLVSGVVTDVCTGAPCSSPGSPTTPE